MPEPQTATEWYVHGIELGIAGENVAAAEAFMRSYELQPTSEALFNAALAHENAGAAIDAITTYERFLAEPGRTEKYVPQAEASIEALMRTVAVLKGVRHAPTRPPAELFIAGQRVELDGFPVLVMPGEVEVEVVDAAGKRASEVYELGAGDALVVDLRALLPPEPEPKPPEDIETPAEPPEDIEPPAPAPRGELLRKLTWAGIGLSAGTAIAAGTMGYLTGRQGQDFEVDTCYEFPDGICPGDFEPGDPRSHNSTYRRYWISTAVLTGVSGALAVASLAVGLASRRYRRSGHGPGARATVQIWPTLGGVAIQF